MCVRDCVCVCVYFAIIVNYTSCVYIYIHIYRHIHTLVGPDFQNSENMSEPFLGGVLQDLTMPKSSGLYYMMCGCSGYLLTSNPNPATPMQRKSEGDCQQFSSDWQVPLRQEEAFMDT